MGPIIAVKIDGRTAHAPTFQGVLTKYGCNIKTRVGFHELDENQCSVSGVIILQLFGKETEIEAMLDEMGKIEGVTYKAIEF